MSQLHIALLFHFNQNLNQFSHLASQACYKGLLHVLRRHARLPFAIHMSGSLIHALQWYDPEPLQLLADGINAGQFTLVGSTYAQNVAYASDDWDNLLQMMLHREVMQRNFGVSPAIFWNPERCWRQSLAPVLRAGGYSHTLIEGDFLRQAGSPQPHAVWQTGQGDHSITLFNDDQHLKNVMNYAIWTGRTGRALDYLRTLAAQPDSDSYYLWYAEDAEATGLWGHARGVLPQSAWANLDRLLTELEQQPWLAITAPTQAPKPQGVLPVIPDGQASWMVASLRATGKPYHEDGYQDWFDFNARSPKLAYFRSLFDGIRARLQASQAAPPANDSTEPSASLRHERSVERSVEPLAEVAAAARLIAQAHLALAAHQYEFGCIGIGQPGDRQWEMARAALVCLRAAELAAAAVSAPDFSGRRDAVVDSPHLSAADPEAASDPFDWRAERRQQLANAPAAATSPGVRCWREDVNDDGQEEICLASARLFAVLTALGGRLLYAFDLQEGVSWVGNENAMPPAPFSQDGAYPVITRTWPMAWIPTTFEADVSSFTAAAADPRILWGQFLPDDWWDGEPETTPTYFAPALPAPSPPEWRPVAAQTRALADYLWLDDHLVLEPAENVAWDVVETADGVIFSVQRDTFTLRKQVTLHADGLEVVYRLRLAAARLSVRLSAHAEGSPESAAPVAVRLVIENELCPSSVDLLDAGRQAAVYWQADGLPQASADAGTRGVLNRAVNYLAVFQAQPAPDDVAGADGLFALTLAPQFSWRLAPGEEAVLGLRWRALKVAA
ncbi:hypothetical protein [Candidatus Amarolinea aalborgensis]|uniref:hypothetical protein n=1 Tax=Candidatus Amarolinea aalborgensis TaxID=2249329 RepID=UPI003BFA3899